MKLPFLVILTLTFIGPLWLLLSGQVDLNSDYRTASRESAHLAPDPAKTPGAVIQVYSARAFNWRGIFASHNWIAIKPKNASNYVVYQIIGWRQFFNQPILVIQSDIPDRYWFNQKPTVILDVRGDLAEKLIPKIHKAIYDYPYPNRYDLWPGPNSNTLPAFVGREVPELQLVMPADAIGKDFLPNLKFFAKAPSGTGYQFSVFGLFGILIAKKEGVEINLLGFVYGVKFSPLAILLPGIGEIPINLKKTHSR